MESDYESLPESRLIFQAISVDGSLTLTVWRDAEPVDERMQELGGMGTLTVQGSRTSTVYHRERLALSREAILGQGPTDEEFERWSNIFSRILNE